MVSFIVLIWRLLFISKCVGKFSNRGIIVGKIKFFLCWGNCIQLNLIILLLLRFMKFFQLGLLMFVIVIMKVFICKNQGKFINSLFSLIMLFVLKSNWCKEDCRMVNWNWCLIFRLLLGIIIQNWNSQKMLVKFIKRFIFQFGLLNN